MTIGRIDLSVKINKKAQVFIHAKIVIAKEE